MPAHNTLALLGEAIQTTDATVTVLMYFRTSPGKVYLVDANIVAIKSDFTAAAGYKRAATFRTDAAGAITQAGATTAIATHEDNAAYECEIVAGTTVLADGTIPTIIIRVTGAAATTINWRVDAKINEVGVGGQYS
jgi:hypothetical protein